MTAEMHLLGESIQEVTLCAWPVVWAGNKYDQDSRDVLETLREWAEEFENYWNAHDEEWMDTHDYRIEIWGFTDKKAQEYIKRFEK